MTLRRYNRESNRLYIRELPPPPNSLDIDVQASTSQSGLKLSDYAHRFCQWIFGKDRKNQPAESSQPEEECDEIPNLPDYQPNPNRRPRRSAKRKRSIGFVDDLDSYYDAPEDFEELETVSGTFIGFIKDGDREYALVDLDDGRKTRVYQHYFKPYGVKALLLQPGDRLTLRKKGYSQKLQHTSWEVKALPIRIISSLSAPIRQKFVEAPLHKFHWLESDDEFERGVEEEGTIFRILSKSNPHHVLVEFSDGATTMVTKTGFLKSGKDIRDYAEGDKITLKKVGYITSEKITKWQVIN